ncbi:MAG TPA: amidohydrolase family protein [Chitinophagaceae bacterium]|nr:amidohydrolase family protein [Chitinophagaceae bacterium]
MPYQKFKADNIFTGTEMLNGDAVLITDENGNVEAIVDTKDAGDGVQTFKGILTPGFINCHCHLELSLMKGLIPGGTGLVDFLLQVLQLRGAKEEDIFNAMQNAEQEMYKGGIAAVGDIGNTAHSLVIKQKSKLHWYNFVEVLGFTEERAEEVIQPFEEVYNQFIQQTQTSNFRLQTSLVPHAPYTISNKMFRLINEASAGKVISVHNQECTAEDELYKTKSGDFFRLYDFLKIETTFFQPSGKSSLQSYLPLLNKAANILLIHNTFTQQEDIDFVNYQLSIVNHKIFFCVCANANLYIENRMPPVDMLRKNNCNIVLGTDSYSSNWSLNILDEMRTIQNKTAFTIPTAELLQWATLNGAKALQIDDMLGSFEKGKQPGVILIANVENGNINDDTIVHRLK